MQRSVVWDYRPLDMELANRRVKLKEAKSLVSRLNDEIEDLQKKTEEHKVGSMGITADEEEKYVSYFYFFPILFNNIIFLFCFNNYFSLFFISHHFTTDSKSAEKKSYDPKIQKKNLSTNNHKFKGIPLY
jgi:hypothetical protein